MKIYFSVLRFSLLLSVVLAGSGRTGWGQGRAPFPIHEGGASDLLEKAPPAVKPKLFRGYGRFQAQFVKLCELLREDGRSDKLYEILYPASERDPDCVACRPLLRPLALACKPKTSFKKKTGSQPKMPLPKQREPHAKVIEAGSVLFRDLANEKDLLGETVKAVKKLLELLRDASGKTPAERDYYTVLAEYVEAPFKEALRGGVNKENETPEREHASRPEIRLDELF